MCSVCPKPGRNMQYLQDSTSTQGHETANFSFAVRVSAPYQLNLLKEGTVMPSAHAISIQGIHHEYRTRRVNGSKMTPGSRRCFSPGEKPFGQQSGVSAGQSHTFFYTKTIAAHVIVLRTVSKCPRTKQEQDSVLFSVILGMQCVRSNRVVSTLLMVHQITQAYLKSG